ncbi:MAG: hypothetical protein DMF60_02535 [Acidobacteria bacterium]|nr:MAG: hypothetical protein DMF60_02535 [Acidobacteriota bacterium]
MLNQKVGTNSFDAEPLLQALMALKKGDFSARLPEESTGVGREIARALNGIVDLNKSLAKELERVSGASKTDRKITRNKKLPGAKGEWAKSFLRRQVTHGQSTAEDSRCFEGRRLFGSFAR